MEAYAAFYESLCTTITKYDNNNTGYELNKLDQRFIEIKVHT